MTENRNNTRNFLWTAALLACAAAANALIARGAERRHPARGRFITVRGTRLHYLDHGPRDAESTPVVLVHGNGTMADDFVASDIVDRVARERRVIVFDRPGSGFSARPRDRVWSAKAQAGVMSDALRQLGVERPIVAGHSWGTLVALAMAEVPGGTSGLVLVSGCYYPAARFGIPLVTPVAIPILGDLLRYTIAPLFGWLMAPAMVRKAFAPAAVTPSFRAMPISLTLRPSQLRAVAADAALLTAAVRRARRGYRDISVPVAVVASHEDRIVNSRQAERLHREIPGSELHMVRDGGHMLHHQVPDIIVAAIDAVENRARSTGSDRTNGAADHCSIAGAMRVRARASRLRADTDHTAERRRRAAKMINAEEAAYDQALENTFPASDPPANSGTT